jgi:NDP-sugar pyrophosphorylase family protein
MFMNNTPDAIVLCGGPGLRLRSITGNAPKSMASIGGRPFLELLLRQLKRNGFRRVILAVGYQQEVIRAALGERAFGLNVAYSPELSPLGTGGAVRKAADIVESDGALIMNGDSYTDVDLLQFVAEHGASNVDVSLVVVPADRRDDVGSVSVDGSGRVTRFDETQQNTTPAPYSNAGIYMMSRAVLDDIAPGVHVSVESELFPRWLVEGRHVRAFVHAGHCVDIGTPERYQAAQDILANVEGAACVAREANQR